MNFNSFNRHKVIVYYFIDSVENNIPQAIIFNHYCYPCYLWMTQQQVQLG